MNMFKERYRFHPSAKNYIEKTLNYEWRISKLCKIIFYIINVLITINVLSGTVITTLVISRILWNQFPVWFFFATAGITATSTFLGSVLNFFLINKTANDYEEKGIKIDEEIILYKIHAMHYSDEKTRDIVLFDKIFAIRNQGYFIERAQRRLKYEEFKYASSDTKGTSRDNIKKTSK